MHSVTWTTSIYVRMYDIEVKGHKLKLRCSTIYKPGGK